MPKAISNTSPLLYLYWIEKLDLFPKIFSEIWTPDAVVMELKEGKENGYDVPDAENYEWLKIINPLFTPSEWLAFDLGPGELATMALAIENPKFVVILDDALARRTARAAGLEIWGTLRILIEAKNQGFVQSIEPLLKGLQKAGMWLSEGIIQRVLSLSGEGSEK